MNTNRLIWLSGISGLALIALGGYTYARQRGYLAGSGGLGRAPRRLRGDSSVAEAPIIDSYSDGNMRTVLRQSEDMPIEQRLATIQSLVNKSVQDPEMRRLALHVASVCAERDKVCEARAVYDAIKRQVRYTGDVGNIAHPDGTVDGIDLYQSARRTWELKGGDCLPFGTLLLNDKHEFVPIERLVIGSRIWGRDNWTTVKDVWFKGVLPVDVVRMNNGSSFMATGDHKVYVALCPSHPVRWDNELSCSCPLSERSIERLKVSQLEPGMVLVQPETIAFGQGQQDPRRAYIEGLYISDGYMSHESDFDISGRDGHPKEAQKREVQEICSALDIPTTWFRKSIRIRDKEWAHRVGLMGHKARFKEALSIALSEDAASELLRGIMADSGANTHGAGRTFTTTSRKLMLQTRILHRMFGRSCSERYIVDHGGEGEYPVHRLGVRDVDRTDGRSIKLLRVKEIDREALNRSVYDISTDDHYVYLPEADVVVSNCDDQAILGATLLALNGIDPVLRVVKQKGDTDWSHIYCGFYRGNKFIAVDTTLPGNRSFGVEGTYAIFKDFPA